jgi:hypothetical protein
MLCFEQDLPQSLQEGNMLRVDARSHYVASALSLRKGRSWTSSMLGQSMVFPLVMHLILEHIVCPILKLTKSWRLVR